MRAVSMRKYQAQEHVQYAYLQRRLAAFTIDYFISSIVISLIPMLITSIITQETSFNLATFSSMPFLWQGICSVIAILTAIGYFVWYPMSGKHPGQTPGKQMMKIQVICRYGDTLKAGNLFRREIIGSLLLEGQTAFSSAYLRCILGLLLPEQASGLLTLLSVLLSLVSVVIAVLGKRHLMLHDYVGDTVVVNKQ